ncbi:hypothetical protein KI387_031736, partial [Taxus chinensis]
MDVKDANRPVQLKRGTSVRDSWDKGTRGTQIAEGAESQSSNATCHWKKRDEEAHFGRIGSFCPKQFGTSGTNVREGRERAGRPADQSNHDTCHKGKGPKVKGRVLKGQPEPIRRGHVSYG